MEDFTAQHNINLQSGYSFYHTTLNDELCNIADRDHNAQFKIACNNLLNDKSITQKEFAIHYGVFPKFSVSVYAEGTYSPECVKCYNPFVMLNFDTIASKYPVTDKRTEAEAERVRDLYFSQIPYAVAAFRTFVNGVCVLVHTPGNPNNLRGNKLQQLHAMYFDAIANYCNKRFRRMPSDSGKDMMCMTTVALDRNIKRKQLPNMAASTEEWCKAYGVNTSIKMPNASNASEANLASLSEAKLTFNNSAILDTETENELQELKKDNRYANKHGLDYAVKEFSPKLTERGYCLQDEKVRFMYALACILYALNFTEKSVVKFMTKNYKLTAEEIEQSIEKAFDRKDLRRIDKKTNTNYIDDDTWMEIVNRFNFRYNVFTKKVEFLVEHNDDNVMYDEQKGCNIDDFEWKSYTDHQLNSLVNIINGDYGFKFNPRTLSVKLDSNLTPSFNPVKVYLESLPTWKRGDHDFIDTLADTITTDNQPLWRKVFKKWMVSMVIGWTNDDMNNQICPILIGAQGIGKSRFCDCLLPKVLKKYITTGGWLTDDRDDKMLVTNKLLYIIDEMDEHTRKELSVMKRLISTPSIAMRRAYGTTDEEFVRWCSFIATTNVEYILSDSTGNRRFPVFKIESMLNPYVKDVFNRFFNYAGLYSEAYALSKDNDFEYYLNHDDIDEINEHNTKFEVDNYEESLILINYDKGSDNNPASKWLSAAEIYDKLGSMYPKTILNKKLISIALSKHGFNKAQKNHTRKYFVAAKNIVDTAQTQANIPSAPSPIASAPSPTAASLFSELDFDNIYNNKQDDDQPF